MLALVSGLFDRQRVLDLHKNLTAADVFDKNIWPVEVALALEGIRNGERRTEEPANGRVALQNREPCSFEARIIPKGQARLRRVEGSNCNFVPVVRMRPLVLAGLTLWPGNFYLKLEVKGLNGLPVQ